MNQLNEFLTSILLILLISIIVFGVLTFGIAQYYRAKIQYDYNKYLLESINISEIIETLNNSVGLPPI